MKKKYQVRITNWSKHVITSGVILGSILMIMVSCKKDNDDDTVDLVGNWVEVSDFEGLPRTDAVAFTINGKGYVGTGFDGEDRLSDFWEYDPVKNTWTKKKDFPGAARSGAVSFSIGSKGYIGTGYDGMKKLKDFWEYNSETNTWDSIDAFGGSARYGAIAFTINNKGYVGTGYDGYYLKDFWEYDPEKTAGSRWTQKVSVGGSKRKDAVGFVINGKGYVCNGIDNGSYESDFWEYDPATDVWTAKRSISNLSDDTYDDDYTSIRGISKTAYTINGKGYIATGGEGTVGSTVWEYNPSDDSWKQKTSFEGTQRVEAVSFAIGDRAYVTTGRSSSYYFDDIWAFDPNSEYNEND
jgi:N-acetylneuraminic acid mutarotase